jgi:hypothetical protein
MIPTFETKEQLFKHLKDNNAVILQAKKSCDKYADSVSLRLATDLKHDDLATKEAGVASGLNVDEIVIKSAINTTNIFDSHGDVHIPGLWGKSLKEAKNLLLLQEHQMKFDKVISRNVTATAKLLSWSDLGYDYEGKTQALVFESVVNKSDNEFMFNQYLKGNVTNHSVGMRYVKMELAVNSKDKYFADEKATWDKYYNDIVNKSDVDEAGYFYAILEAKCVEGSAVLVGSNQFTPTISITEAVKDTSTIIPEPVKATQMDLMKQILLTNKNS